nr:hypothetical protein [Tanacetum cinerariifolium]
MFELLNEPVQIEATTIMLSHILETIHENQVALTPPATPPTKTKTKKKQAKNLVQKAIKMKTDWKKAIISTKPSHNKRTHDDQDLKDRVGEKVRREGEKKTAKELLIQRWFNELVDVKEEPEEHEYKDDFVTLFYKLVKKIFKKDKITKEDVDGLAFELLNGTCKNNI